VNNTVLNAGASGGTIFNNGGTVTSLGYNLASDNGGGVLTGPGDQINTDPMLGPVARQWRSNIHTRVVKWQPGY